MILIRTMYKIERIWTARTKVKPYSPGKISVGNTVYNESEVLDLTNLDAIRTIQECEKNVTRAQKQLDEAMRDIFNQFKE